MLDIVLSVIAPLLLLLWLSSVWQWLVLKRACARLLQSRADLQEENSALRAELRFMRGELGPEMAAQFEDAEW